MILNKVIAVVHRRAWIVVVTVVLAMMAAGAASSSAKSTWHSTAVLVVPAFDGSTDGSFSGSATDSSRLATTYARLLSQDRQILQATSVASGTDVDAIQDQISTASVDGTSIIEVTVSGAPSEDEAAAVMDAFVAAAIKPATTLVAPGSLEVVRVDDPALDAVRSSTLVVAVGAILGLALGVVIVVFWERAHPRIDTVEELEVIDRVPTTVVADFVSAARALAERWVGLAEDQGHVVFVTVGDGEVARAKALLEGIIDAEPLPPEWPNGSGGVVELRLAAPRDTGSLSEAAIVVLVVRPGVTVAALNQRMTLLSSLGRPVRWAIFDG